MIEYQEREDEDCNLQLAQDPSLWSLTRPLGPLTHDISSKM